MSQFKWVRSSAAVIAVCVVLSSCENGQDRYGCGGGGPHLANYRISDYVMQAMVLESSDDFLGETFVLYEQGTEILPKDFTLQLDWVVDWTATQRREGGVTFSLFASAFACSPRTYYIPTQRVLSYQLTSSGSFGEGYPVGADISALFSEEYRDAPRAIDVSQYVEGGIVDEEIPLSHTTFRLNAQPIDVDHIFTYLIELDDGSVYQLESPVVSFDLSSDN